jgi:hypothetical protein
VGAACLWGSGVWPDGYGNACGRLRALEARRQKGAGKRARKGFMDLEGVLGEEEEGGADEDEKVERLAGGGGEGGGQGAELDEDYDDDEEEEEEDGEDGGEARGGT